MVSTPVSIATITCIIFVHCLQESNARNAANDDDDEDLSAEDMLDDANDMGDELPPLLKGSAAVERRAAALAVSQQVKANADAGANIALRILDDSRALGGSPTARDYEQILRVCCALPAVGLVPCDSQRPQCTINIAVLA